MNRKLLALVALTSAVAGTVNASELIVTAESNTSRGVTMMSMDMVSNGDARGIQARISVPADASVSTKDCLSALPDGFKGTCVFNQGEIRLMVFAFEDRTLPAGLVELGKIKVSGHTRGEAGLKVEDFQAVDRMGSTIPSKSTMSSDRQNVRSRAKESLR